MTEQRGMSRRIAWGGILLALSLGTLFFATIIPGAELTLYALSSVYSAILMIETQPKAGWIFYGASLALALILIPNILAVLPYALFFGPYGPIKSQIESLGKPGLEIMLKLLFFNAMILVGAWIFGELLWSNLGLPSVSILILAIGAQLFLLLYDKIFSLIITQYLQRFRKL